MCLVQIHIGRQTVLFGAPPVTNFMTNILLSLHSCSTCWQVDVFCEPYEFWVHAHNAVVIQQEKVELCELDKLFVLQNRSTGKKERKEKK